VRGDWAFVDFRFAEDCRESKGHDDVQFAAVHQESEAEAEMNNAMPILEAWKRLDFAMVMLSVFDDGPYRMELEAEVGAVTLRLEQRGFSFEVIAKRKAKWRLQRVCRGK
jgi:hypothetical protein